MVHVINTKEMVGRVMVSYCQHKSFIIRWCVLEINVDELWKEIDGLYAFIQSHT